MDTGGAEAIDAKRKCFHGREVRAWALEADNSDGAVPQSVDLWTWGVDGCHSCRMAQLTVCRNKQDLLEQLNELKTELASLRVNKVTGGNASKLTKMYVCIRVWHRNRQ